MRYQAHQPKANLMMYPSGSLPLSVHSSRMRKSGLDGFGFMTNDSILQSNREWTITFNSGAWFQPNEDTVLEGLRQRMLDGTVLRARRPLFSGRFAITFVPNNSQPLSYWIDAITAMWYDMGYKDAKYVTIDSGVESSQGGGASEVLTDTGEAVGKTVGKTVQSLTGGLLSGLGAPIVIGIVLIGGAYVYSSFKGVTSFRTNPKRRRR
jgi:hypothetical protein